ncbi:hypothetical protein PUNSTDRAFT_48599, partial [Punctularia strigosozonata HHB-11173 SS5]|uniref:uncharacterized protein n=1 Tax=Punctularia strigosozonata (strain HHB-11173) TaxID=741275 RepID=UPI0004417C10
MAQEQSQLRLPAYRGSWQRRYHPYPRYQVSTRERIYSPPVMNTVDYRYEPLPPVPTFLVTVPLTQELPEATNRPDSPTLPEDAPVAENATDTQETTSMQPGPSRKVSEQDDTKKSLATRIYDILSSWGYGAAFGHLFFLGGASFYLAHGDRHEVVQICGPRIAEPELI